MVHPVDKLIMTFTSQADFHHWLDLNCAISDGIWLRMHKKASNVPTVVYAHALDEALCYGWIDGQIKQYDAESYIRKFTPRRSKSVWSQRNTEHVARLIKEGRMQSAGLKEVEAAQADGRWDQAYDSPSKMVIPDDFLQALKKDSKAKAYFDTLNKANLYAIAYRLQTAKKPETRSKWLQKILAMLAEGKAFH